MNPADRKSKKKNARQLTKLNIRGNTYLIQPQQPQSGTQASAASLGEFSNQPLP